NERELLDTAIRNGGVDDINPVLAIIEKTDSINSAMEIARTHALEARQAIGILPESPWRAALEQLADYSTNRDH
ncbi:MAG: octaprenyl-diphosphate synthase, partial [Xanthomonadales bacterium]|nr:octaprenyl-diphosphate synthase [Xanthomonadales bacterium]